MPGSTENVSTFNGVFVANDGIFWVQSDQTPNTVVTTTVEQLTYWVEGEELFYNVEAA